jgi:hypothetical protein
MESSRRSTCSHSEERVNSQGNAPMITAHEKSKDCPKPMTQSSLELLLVLGDLLDDQGHIIDIKIFEV